MKAKLINVSLLCRILVVKLFVFFWIKNIHRIKLHWLLAAPSAFLPNQGFLRKRKENIILTNHHSQIKGVIRHPLIDLFSVLIRRFLSEGTDLSHLCVHVSSAWIAFEKDETFVRSSVVTSPNQNGDASFHWAMRVVWMPFLILDEGVQRKHRRWRARWMIAEHVDDNSLFVWTTVML